MIPFSVLVCVYDGDCDRFVAEALRSLLCQSLAPAEIVIVVDGPVRENLAALLENFQSESHLARIVSLKENVGHGNARRIGLDACAHDIVALMDADDISLPSRFEIQIPLFGTRPDLDVVSGTIEEFVVEQGEKKVWSLRKLPEHDADIKRMLKWRCPVNQPAAVLRKSSVQAAGGYVDWYCNEDYYLWVRMAQAGAVFHNVTETILQFRVSEGTYRRRGGLKYFLSEARLQHYIFRQGLSSLPVLLWNISIRFGAQVLCPPSLRRVLYTKFFRGRASVNGVTS